MEAAQPLHKGSSNPHGPGKKHKPEKPVVIPLPVTEVANLQTQKPESTAVTAGSANPYSNRMNLNGTIAPVHGSRTIYDKGAEIRYGKFQESLAETGDINHPDTQKLEKSYIATLSISQIRDYRNLKNGTYLPKTMEEQAAAYQAGKKTLDTNAQAKPLQQKEILGKANMVSVNQKKEEPVAIKKPQIAPVLSDLSNNSKRTADQNENFYLQNNVKDEKKSGHKKSNINTKGEKEAKVVVPAAIKPVVMPRMDKAVDSEQAEIAPDAQTTLNIGGLVAAAQEFRDQGVEARSQVKSQKEAAKGLKSKIREVEKAIRKSDDDLQKSEDSVQAKEHLVNKLEKGLETSVKRQQKVEQEVVTYREEYQKNKTKASDLNKEANDLLGGSQKHQDPENADSGKLTQKLKELNTNAGTINQAVSQSGNTVQKLTQEAQQAKAKNAAMQKDALSSKESLRKSKAKLAADTKKNSEAKSDLIKLNPKLKDAESQSKKLNKEADSLLQDSYSIELEVIKAQNAYYQNMATIEGRNSLTQKEKDKIQQTPKDLNPSERLLMDFAQLKTQDEQVAFLRTLNPAEQNLLKDKFEQITANYDSDQSEQQTSIDENVESIRNAQIENFNNKRKDALQKPMNLVTKNLNKITGLKRLWMSITIAFSGIWNDITSITWSDVGKFINSIINPLEWYNSISNSVQGIWNDLTNWKGFSRDPVGMILQKAAGIANKVLAIAGVITGILGILTLAAAVGSIFTLGGLAPLAAWLGGATITMGTITFWIGAIALGLNILNGIKNIYDIHTAKTAEVLFKNSGELKSDITNSGMAIFAIIGGKASQKGGASIKNLAKTNPKTFGKRMFINVKNGLKAKIVSIPRKITSVFKKETWMKAAQSFKAAYKKAQEWVTEPFRKKTATPKNRNLNQLPFEEQTVPDRMREQPFAKDKGKANIQEENVKPAQAKENTFEESVFRQDNTPYSPKGSKEGRIKSHIKEEGNLTPADKNGSATVSDHVRGSEPMKSKSPYTSFSEEGPGIGKTYGDNVIEVDIKRLEADIAAGKISEVEVLRPEKVQAELQTKIDQAMKRFEENPTPKNQKRVDDAVRDLNNSVRDKEILIKGEIPSEYFKVKATGKHESQGVMTTKINESTQSFGNKKSNGLKSKEQNSKISSSQNRTFDESLGPLAHQETQWINENSHWRESNYGPKPGLPVTEQTIATGTVQMELHPNFNNLVSEMEELGYKVTIIEQDFGNIKIDPHVKVIEIINKKGEFLYFEKEVTLLKGMDYETAIHEYGHVKQLIKLEKEGIKLATEKGFYRDNGTFVKTYDGNSKIWSAIEYHNRLIDLKRLQDLKSAGVKIPEILMEQTKMGVAEYQSQFTKSLGNPKYGMESRIKVLKSDIGSIYDEILQLEQKYKY
ncbi:hypothetical protein FY557_05535 [Chryseobacterium sp. SN22]|uniref:phage tail protein n=1 Tax=Chryseobacterium sp. SN22 TaxID=2606431 RepID=UPI0011EC0F83|nr:hypothetical protein [Chryseobacterium sp. SN22]KAA0129361.1 hypothetical protein FY557_05535 [Chryseobacterium sp. SN22]